jgi:hypothetical protein
LIIENAPQHYCKKIIIAGIFLIKATGQPLQCRQAGRYAIGLTSWRFISRRNAVLSFSING